MVITTVVSSYCNSSYFESYEPKTDWANCTARTVCIFRFCCFDWARTSLTLVPRTYPAYYRPPVPRRGGALLCATERHTPWVSREGRTTSARRLRVCSGAYSRKTNHIIEPPKRYGRSARYRLQRLAQAGHRARDPPEATVLVLLVKRDYTLVRWEDNSLV